MNRRIEAKYKESKYKEEVLEDFPMWKSTNAKNGKVQIPNSEMFRNSRGPGPAGGGREKERERSQFLSDSVERGRVKLEFARTDSGSEQE